MTNILDYDLARVCRSVMSLTEYVDEMERKVKNQEKEIKHLKEKMDTLERNGAFKLR